MGEMDTDNLTPRGQENVSLEFKVILVTGDTYICIYLDESDLELHKILLRHIV